MTDPENNDDLEYDLAHENSASDQPVEDQSPAYVSTTTGNDASGDYGYDSCHDMPPEH